MRREGIGSRIGNGKRNLKDRQKERWDEAEDDKR
jgi:hypothetical protein